MTLKEPTKLLDWMRFLGLRTGMLAKRFGLSHGAIDVAAISGCRGSRWLPALSQLVHVPVEILLDTSPEDPAAGEYLLPALLRAADIRMRRYRFEPPSSPQVRPHKSSGDAHAPKTGASKPTSFRPTPAERFSPFGRASGKPKLDVGAAKSRIPIPEAD